MRAVDAALTDGNPFLPGLYTLTSDRGGPAPPPPGNAFWVEDATFDQMTTEDGSLDYIFVTE